MKRIVAFAFVSLLPLSSACVSRDYNASTVKSTDPAEGLALAQKNVETRVQALRAHAFYRAGAEPYLKLHEASFPVKGTVILFHGFSGIPAQQSPLADYLFDAGFDVYSANVAGHGLLNQDDESVSPENRSVHWPVTRLSTRHQSIEAQLKKNGWDQQLRNMDPSQAGAFFKEQLTKSLGDAIDVARVALEFKRIENAVNSPSESEFNEWFHSTHMDFLKVAKEAYEDVKSLRGPFHTIGLSSGATMSLALGAEYPSVFKSVVAFTPLLEVGHKDPQKAKDSRDGVRNLGPISTIAPWFGWPPGPRFPLGAFTALDKFGRSHVNQRPVQKKYRGEGGVPHPNVFLVTTHHEDAADTSVSQSFFNAIGGTALGHASFHYTENMWVPHPVSALKDRSQGMINMYYKTLFQETLRFISKGRVKTERLALQDLDDTLPGKTALGEDEGIPLPPHFNLQEVR